MKNILPERLAVIRATLSLLYQSNPRAFAISALVSVPEPLFYPTTIFLLKQLFEYLTGSNGTVQISSQVILLSLALLATLLSTGPILLGVIGLAVTLFVIAPLMIVMLLMIAIPAAMIERRFSDAMYDLQEGNHQYAKQKKLLAFLCSIEDQVCCQPGLTIDLHVMKKLNILYDKYHHGKGHLYL